MQRFGGFVSHGGLRRLKAARHGLWSRTRGRIEIEAETRPVRPLGDGVVRLAMERIFLLRWKLPARGGVALRIIGPEWSGPWLRRGLNRTQRRGRLTRQGEHIIIGDDATDGSQNLLHGGFMGPLVGYRLLVRG